MPGHLKLTFALVICAGALVAATAAAAAPTKMEKRLVAQINDVRADHGLRKLKVGSRLQRGAHSWARHLIRADSFHHARLAARTGENLAWGTCNWYSPRQAVRAWLRSSSHRALLLDRRFRAVGTGWARGPWRGYGCVKMAVARFRY
ncbi:MAG TPA: CAP domain-containing protein [Gaiellaceae bacterium]|nr:CAP domain-containing protein [Gaiellaceae bacterium]